MYVFANNCIRITEFWVKKRLCFLHKLLQPTLPKQHTGLKKLSRLAIRRAAEEEGNKTKNNKSHSSVISLVQQTRVTVRAVRVTQLDGGALARQQVGDVDEDLVDHHRQRALFGKQHPRQLEQHLQPVKESVVSSLGFTA